MMVEYSHKSNQCLSLREPLAFFQEMRRIEHDDKIKTVFLREGRLYVSSLNKHNQDTITLYDLETLKLIKKIKIRSNGKHFLTDFIVTNFAG